MVNPTRRVVVALGLLLLFTLALAACGQEAEQVEVTRIVEVITEVPGETIEVTRIVEVEPEDVEPIVEIPFVDLWVNSPHNDVDGEAFRHWDGDDPPEIPTACAKCHSTFGFLDFVGADGTEAGVVDAPAAVGSTVQCVACHNSATVAMTSVVFPSGIEITGLGPEARCMQCHQGRESTVSVNQSIANAGVEGQEDTVSEDLGFRNIHYYAAAATMYGTATMGGYEYEGKAYDGKFDHVPGYDSCVDCHNPHTLELRFDECSQCHQGLTSADELVNVRMYGSLVDYDGDGNESNGIYYEIEGLRGMLYTALQSYAMEVVETPIVYTGDRHPYFFEDVNGDGAFSDGDSRYASWTPRLLKAAYNYQVSLKDPGRFAHGGKYIIQLLYDSIESLNDVLSAPVDLSNANRIDHGHFAGSEEAFRHWDEEGAVPGSCSRCHSAAGLPLYIEQGVSINQPTASGLNCATCHNDLTQFTIYETASATFPSGATLGFEDSPEANLCLQCHQGRSSTRSVDTATAGIGDNEASERLRFINIHYFAAGATLFGTEAQGAYQFAGQEYLGRFEHVRAFDTCVECHDVHRQTVEIQACANCHEGADEEEGLYNIRVSEVDYDGDGDATEGLAGEVATMAEALMAAMQDYAARTEGVDAIVYNAARYPYYFVDANGNGVADPDETTGYATFTPSLLRAAYNYQYVLKDPGAFAHNGKYIIQVLYDTLVDLGADVSGMTRP
jgi:hypothetical protein